MIEKVQCDICNKWYSKKGIFTHIDRTHNKSTKYSNGYNGRYQCIEFKANLKSAVNLSYDQKLGKLLKFNVQCSKCNTTFDVEERELSFPSKEKYYCSRACANSHVVTDEHRKKTSETLSGKEYKPPEEITKICQECGKEFTYIKTNCNRQKECCSKSCAMKKSRRIKNAELRKTRTAFRNYRLDCQFQFNLKDYPNEFEFTLIEKYGWYLPKNRGNNLNGVSRDHMVSVRFGFDNNIPPEHIRHPANCRLLQHNSNVSKGSKNSITYDQLLQRITAWDTKYIRCNKQASIAHDQDNKDRNNSFNR